MPRMHGRSPLELCVYWGWLPDSDAGATHWVSPARDYHPRTGLRSNCGRRCIPSERTHAWRKLPRCRECVSSLGVQQDRATTALGFDGGVDPGDQ